MLDQILKQIQENLKKKKIEKKKLFRARSFFGQATF